MSAPALKARRSAAATTPTLRCAAFNVPANDAIVHGLGPIFRATMASWGIEDEDLIFAALLSLREVGCNAVKHGPTQPNPQIAIFLLLESGLDGPDRIVVTVQDQGTGRIRVPLVDDMNAVEEYRGLALLGGLGMRVEPFVHPDGHSVVSWMPVAPEDRERTCKCLCWDHIDRSPHCDGMVKDGTGTLILDPFGGPVEICRPCAESVAETIRTQSTNGDGTARYSCAAASLARWR